jgi:putative colanic acid biosynthesis UDP-glucose lipid carrier transferase
MRGEYYSRVIKVLIFISDFLLINLAFISTRQLGYGYTLSNEQFTSFFLIFSLVWIIAGFYYKIYRVVYRVDPSGSVKSISLNLLSSFGVHFLILFSILNTFRVYEVSIEFMGYIYFLSGALIFGSRVFYKLVLKYFEVTAFNFRKVVVVGATRSGKALHQFFSTYPVAGYQFKGFFDDQVETPQVDQHLIIGQLKDLKDFCKKESIDEIYFALPLSHHELLQDLSRFADDNFIYFRMAPDFGKVIPENCNVFLINSSIPILTTRREPLGISLNAYLKRAFDIVFSSLVILTVFPVIFPIIAIAIKLESPGPIFFKQLRPGRKNKLFECYKFRTMRVNNSTELQATKNDSRITRVGAILRKTNLDELPQFFNVLLGSMSVVGPRPNMISQLEEYSKTIELYKLRHFVTPGITGYAQVNGFRGETREPELMRKRVEYDVQYMENWSMAFDLKIIFLTVWNMMKGEKNAY